MSTKDILLWALNFIVLLAEAYFQLEPQFGRNKPEASRRCAAVGMGKYGVMVITNILFGNWLMAVWFAVAFIKDTASFFKLSELKGNLWED